MLDLGFNHVTSNLLNHAYVMKPQWKLFLVGNHTDFQGGWCCPESMKRGHGICLYVWDVSIPCSMYILSGKTTTLHIALLVSSLSCSSKLSNLRGPLLFSHLLFNHLFLTLGSPMDCSTPGFPVLHYFPEFLKLMFTELVMPSNHLILSSSSPAAF